MRATEICAASLGRLRLTITTVVLLVLVGTVIVFVRPASGDVTVATADSGAPVASGSAAPQPPPARIERPVVLLYGDSLAWEAREHFVAAFARHPGIQVITRTFGGTAICDWLEMMRADAAELAPGAVIVEFSGNALTDCMLDGNGRPLRGDPFVDRYRDDAHAVASIFEPVGAHLYFVGAPRPRPTDDARENDGGRLATVYRQIAATSSGRVEFVDAGAAVLDHGGWTRTLPCLPIEPCEGGTDISGQPVNVVRAPDGNHFCPTGEDADAGVTGDCPVWSSGAYRFARAMAGPVIDVLPS